MERIKIKMKKMLLTIFLIFAFVLPVSAVGTNENLLIDLGDSVTIEMVKIQHATFLMGSAEDSRYSNEGPVHTVTITKDYYIGKYEVTQGQWTKIMGRNPSYFKLSNNHPVEMVSWYDICDNGGFLEKINTLTGKTFRLPTEAEWEYACRAGTQTQFYWNAESLDKLIENYAWYNDNSNSTTHPVGQKLPNTFGLHDMSGNVWEWCNDYYESYVKAAEFNPSGPVKGSSRVLRGGAWHDYTNNCRSAFRDYCAPSYSRRDRGFRLALSPNN